MKDRQEHNIRGVGVGGGSKTLTKDPVSVSIPLVISADYNLMDNDT